MNKSMYLLGILIIKSASCSAHQSQINITLHDAHNNTMSFAVPETYTIAEIKQHIKQNCIFFKACHKRTKITLFYNDQELKKTLQTVKSIAQDKDVIKIRIELQRY